MDREVFVYVHTAPDKSLIGAIGDSAPDRWGRVLMRRAERRRALAAGEMPRALTEIDYLLMVHDEARQGALRFATQEGGPFLAPEDGHPIPPLVDLPRLMGAADRVADYFELARDDARAIAAEVGQAVSEWRAAARSVGLANSEIQRMASAFEHEDLRAATAGRPAAPRQPD